MDLGLKGSSALVTGASEGIGLACARSLAAEGCAVHLVSRSKDRLEEAAEAIRAESGVEVGVWPADLSRPEVVLETVAAHADVDILVNNAGAIPGGTIHEVDGPTWRAGWDLKVFGYIDMTRAMLEHMYARGAGVIVNVIGTGGVVHAYEYVAGSTGNASLMAFTDAVGARSLDHGVRVLGVNPGAVETRRHHRIAAAADAKPADGSTAAWRHYVRGDLPHGRAAHPHEIGDVVAFLASPRSSYISGTVINVDGGRVHR